MNAISTGRISRRIPTRRIKQLSRPHAPCGLLSVENAPPTATRRSQMLLRARARRQEALALLGQRALSGVDNATLLEECAALVVQILDVTSCAVWEHFPARSELAVRASAGLDAAMSRAVVRDGTDSLAGRVLRGRIPVVTPDIGRAGMPVSAVGTVTAATGAPAPEALCGVSSVGVLIGGRHGSEPFGVLQAHSRRRRVFTTEDEFFIQAVANVVAISIARVEDEKSLRLAEMRYRRIAANTPGMVYQFRLTAEGGFSFPFASEGCREMFGLEPQNIYDNPLIVIGVLHEADRDTLFPAILASAQTMTQFHWLGRYYAPGGKVCWMRADSRPELQPDGSVIWDGMMFDISALKEAEQAAREAREEAERANRAKSEFLSRMSHELRTPLNAILGFGEFLQAQETREIPKDCLGHIVKAGSHLLGLINEVLNIARIESGHIALSIVPVCVGRVVEEALDLIRGAARERRIELHWAPGPDAARCVLADAGRFKQVLLNLLSNAVKYNVEGGVVSIVCRARGEEKICLEVGDTGPGIPVEKLGRIFVAFDRLGAENTGVQGTGLGLALSKCLVEALSGTIEVESEPGVGSVFRVVLPAAPAGQADPAAPPAMAAAVTAAAAAKPAAKRAGVSFAGEHRVLYIEDDDANFRLVERLLDTHPSIKLTRGATAAAGLDEISRELPDLLLLDLHLPDMPGDEVLARLREDPRTQKLPVIIMTADATQASIDRLLAAGADNYITKPLDLRQLLSAMRGLLEGPPSPAE